MLSGPQHGHGTVGIGAMLKRGQVHNEGYVSRAEIGSGPLMFGASCRPFLVQPVPQNTYCPFTSPLAVDKASNGEC